jgi:hypothetical protein
MASPEKRSSVWIPQDGRSDHIDPPLREAADRVFDYLLRRPGPQRNDPSLTAEIVEDSVRVASRSRQRNATAIRNWFSYLLTICTRRLIRQARREEMLIRVQSLDSLIGDRRAWQRRTELGLQVEQLLDLMDASTRRMAELRLEQRGWPEIGELMGYKGGDAARKHFEAGLARLRKRITEAAETGEQKALDP